MLLHGDCYGLIPDGGFDLVITDPPYDFGPGGISGRGMFSPKNAGRYGRKRAVAALSELETLGSTRFCPAVMLDLLKAKMERFQGYFFCNKTLVPEYLNWAAGNGFSYDILVMGKVNPVPAHSTHHDSDLEYIILIRGKGTYFKCSGLALDDYRKLYRVTCKKKTHPAEKPVELLERFCRVSCPEGGTVLDPFMGSGSTGIACLNTGRNFIGIEKDGYYFKVAETRIREAEGYRETLLFKEYA